jgi:hypothetical protein
MGLGLPLLAIAPSIWRLLQCFRRLRDSKKPFPHLINATKYVSSIIPTIILFCDTGIYNQFVIIIFK